MGKIIEIMGKNLKVFIRDKKALVMMMMVPIFVFIMMGLVLRDMNSVNISQYTVGFINEDLNSNILPRNDYQSIPSIVGTIENNSAEEKGGLFKIQNFSLTDGQQLDKNLSITTTDAAMIKEEIIAYVVFEKDFQEKLNEAGIIRIGVYDNDTSTNAEFYPQLKRTFLLSFMENMQFDVDNITLAQFDAAKSSFSSSLYDYLMIINPSYEAKIKTGTATVTILYRESMDSFKLEIFKQTVNASFNQAVSGAGGFPVQFDSWSITGDMTAQTPSYTVYFLSSTSPTTVTIINQTLNGIIMGIINYNPNAIAMNIKSDTTEGRAMSQLTFSVPGFLMYGVLQSMSFIMIMITTEIKQGQFKRLQSSRLKISEFLLGNIAANTVVAFVEIGVGLIIFTLMGINPYYINIPTLVIGIILNTIAASLFLNALALATVPLFKTPEAAAGGIWLFLIPLMMLSGVMFPAEFMAPEMVSVIRFLPTRMAVLAFQAIMINGLPLSDPKFYGNILAQIGIAAVLFGIGVVLFKKFVAQADLKKSKPIKV